MDYESLFYVLVSVSLLMTFAAWDYYRRWRRTRENRDRVVEAYDNYSSSVREQRAQIERASLKHWKRAQKLEADNEALRSQLDLVRGTRDDLYEENGRVKELERNLRDMRTRLAATERHRDAWQNHAALQSDTEELKATINFYRGECSRLRGRNVKIQRELADTQAQVSAADAARGYGKSMNAKPVRSGAGDVGPTDVRLMPQIHCAGCGKVVPAPHGAVRGWCERCSAYLKVAL